MVPFLLFFLFVLSHLVLLCPAHDEQYQQRCPPFQCGDLHDIQFPYRNGSNPECGLYPVNCTGQIQKVQLKEGGHWYGFKSISPLGDSINIDDTQLDKSLHLGNCDSIKSFSFPLPSVISNVSTHNPLTLVNCSRNLDSTHRRELNYTICGDYRIYHPISDTIDFPPECSRIQLPPAAPDQNHNHALKFSSEFTLEVVLSHHCFHCYWRRGGQCRLDSENKFLCFGARKGNKNGKLKLGLGLGLASTVAGLGVFIVTLCCVRKKKSSNKTHQNVEALLRNYGLLQVRRYRYSDIKKMTNSFTEKLGKGGFGDVYKGRLDDGCLVAVKVLNNTKVSNAEEFINEVATISRTSHVNIVSLLGFCFPSAKKRALIFEFMPNGSLEKFIFDENSSESNPHQLDWETHYQISLGIARGLEYLHRGCNTRILHFDIKPHNILLDADFVPKISDFGLAKICTRKESIVSMMGPRGTIGYIAP